MTWLYVALGAIAALGVAGAVWWAHGRRRASTLGDVAEGLAKEHRKRTDASAKESVERAEANGKQSTEAADAKAESEAQSHAATGNLADTVNALE